MLCELSALAKRHLTRCGMHDDMVSAFGTLRSKPNTTYCTSRNKKWLSAGRARMQASFLAQKWLTGKLVD